MKFSILFSTVMNMQAFLSTVMSPKKGSKGRIFSKKLINVTTCIFGSISHLVFLSFVSWRTLETAKEESRVSLFINFLFWWFKISTSATKRILKIDTAK